MPIPKHDIQGALIAWKQAIDSKLLCIEPYPNEESIEDLARSYGHHITTREALDYVGEWFNWDTITTHLKDNPNAIPN